MPIQKIQWQYISYILCKYDENWSSNPRDYEGNKCSFWMRRQNSAYLTNYLTGLRQRLSVGRRMYGDYKTYKFSGSPRDVAMITN